MATPTGGRAGVSGGRRAVRSRRFRTASLARWGVLQFPTRFDRRSEHFFGGTSVVGPRPDKQQRSVRQQGEDGDSGRIGIVHNLPAVPCLGVQSNRDAADIGIPRRVRKAIEVFMRAPPSRSCAAAVRVSRAI
jgi:hypothetical protein